MILQLSINQYKEMTYIHIRAMIYLRHFNEADIMEYHTNPDKYFDEEMMEAFDFITMNIRKGSYEGKSVSGVYIIPIHKKKAKESGFTEHLYMDKAKILKPYKIYQKEEIRFRCVKCDRMARVIKNECKRGTKAKECWSCYVGKK